MIEETMKEIIIPKRIATAKSTIIIIKSTSTKALSVEFSLLVKSRLQDDLFALIITLSNAVLHHELSSRVLATKINQRLHGKVLDAQITYRLFSKMIYGILTYKCARIYEIRKNQQQQNEKLVRHHLNAKYFRYESQAAFFVFGFGAMAHGTIGVCIAVLVEVEDCHASSSIFANDGAINVFTVLLSNLLNEYCWTA